MAEAKHQADWDKLAMAMINARLAFSNPDKVTVQQLIPKAYQREVELTEEQKAKLAERNWFLLAQAFMGRER